MVVRGGGATSKYKIALVEGAIAPASCDVAGASVQTLTSKTYSNLLALVTYSVRVCAQNAAGESSFGVTSSLATKAGAPPNPTGLVVTGRTTDSVTIEWQSGGGSTTSFLVARGSGSTAPSACGSTNVGAATTFTVGSLVSGTYGFRVCAVGPTGLKSSGITIQATTQFPLPPDPVNPKATSYFRAVSLSWSSGGGSTAGYKVAHAPGEVAPTTCSGATQTGTTKYFSGLASGRARHTIHSFRICAVNQSGDMSPGVTITAVAK